MCFASAKVHTNTIYDVCPLDKRALGLGGRRGDETERIACIRGHLGRVSVAMKCVIHA